MIIFIIVIVVLVRHLSKRSNEHNKNFNTLQLMANITGIAFLFGLTWLFGALTVVNADQAFQILFTLANSFQGFLIFIFFCVLNSDIRLTWAQKILGKHLTSQMSNGTTTVVMKKSTPYQTHQYTYKQSESVVTEDIEFDRGGRPAGSEGRPGESKVPGSVGGEACSYLHKSKHHMEEVVTIKLEEEEESEDIGLNLKEVTKSPESEL